MTPTELRDLVRDHIASDPYAAPVVVVERVKATLTEDDRDAALTDLLTALTSRLVGAAAQTPGSVRQRKTAADRAQDAEREEAARDAREEAGAALIPVVTAPVSWRQHAVRVSWQERLNTTYELPAPTGIGLVQKRLRDFTATDCELMAGVVRRKARELSQDADTFRNLMATLRLTGTPTVGALPEQRTRTILEAAA